MCIVTTPALAPGDSGATDVTSPTSTPAIRTGEGMWISVLLVNTALSTNGLDVPGTEPPNTK